MYPIFASFVIFVIFFSWSMRRHRGDDRLKTDSFFQKERAANSTRKKSIESLPYVQIPETLLIPFETTISNAATSFETTISPDDYENLKHLFTRLKNLSTKKILNLTGISNTDLKLSYGIANLTPLMAYDQNYTKLVTTIQALALWYYKSGLLKIAKEYLEFSIQTKSDVSSSYLLLAKIYVEIGESNLIESLLLSVNDVPGSQKKIIDRKLKEFCQSHDLPHS